MTKDWYLVDDVDEIDSPALLIYKERVVHNIELAISMVGAASRLRPHVKTHKSPQVTRLILKAGITKFKCATIAEAEMLGQEGAPDVLLAYQPTGPKIERLLKLIKTYTNTHFSCLIDSVEAARTIAAKASEVGVAVDVFVDINVGMNRTGVMPSEANTLIKACVDMPGVNPIGLHVYDGHLNDTDLTIRRQKANEVYEVADGLRHVLKTGGIAQPVVVLGGSPTFGIHAQREGVECSPGTFVYWDRNYQQAFPDLPFLPAALVLTRVVSVVNDNRVCVDLGHKSIAAENQLARRVYFVNAEGLQPVAQSEEHLVLETSTPHDFKPGDVLYGMPYHVCPTCALYESSYVVEGGRAKEVWHMTARDRKISI
ncbi:MAG: D-TA family PLP-dependent enzyme [Flavisolibacter sp.]